MPRLLTRRYRLPLRTALRTAHGLMVEREGILVRMEDGRDRVGYGEAAPLPGFGGPDLREVEETLRKLGRRPNDETVQAAIAVGGCVGFALAGALAGVRRTGETDVEAGLAKRDYLSVAALLPAGRDALAVVPQRAELGFRTFKWKVGVGAVDDELALLDDVLARLPEGSKLRLDANGAWNRRQSERWLEATAGNELIDYIEQPVAAGERGADDLLMGLAGDYPVGIALDESLATAGDLEKWLDAGWSGVWVLKLGLMGDPATVLARLAAARADVVFSTALETAIGARAVLTAAFGWPGAHRPLGTGVWPLFMARWADGPVAMPFLRWSEVEFLNEEAVWNGAL